jgi:hypothetical protein
MVERGSVMLKYAVQTDYRPYDYSVNNVYACLQEYDLCFLVQVVVIVAARAQNIVNFI